MASSLKSLAALCARKLSTGNGLQSELLMVASRCAVHPSSSLPALKNRFYSHHQRSVSSANNRLHHHSISRVEATPVHISVSSFDNSSHQYVCPSRLSHLFSQLVIMDRLNNVKSYDCPLAINSITEMNTPATPFSENSEIIEPPASKGHNSGVDNAKEAKEIMRIRHKKMKKHKLRKLRKRMYFLWKKQKAARKAKRDNIYWKEISDIKQQADDFNAEAFVKDQLEKARKGGFYIKVMN